MDAFFQTTSHRYLINSHLLLLRNSIVKIVCQVCVYLGELNYGTGTNEIDQEVFKLKPCTSDLNLNPHIQARTQPRPRQGFVPMIF